MAKVAEPSKESSTIFKPQADALEGLYSGSTEWLANNQQGINDLSVQNQNYAQGALDTAAPAWLQQMQGGNLAGYNISGALNNSLSSSMSGPSNEQQALNNAGSGQNYSDAYRQNFVNDARMAQSTMLQGLDGRAAASGMSGGSRHGMATAAGMQDINSNLQSNLADIGYQDYTKNIERQQLAGANADQLTAGQQEMLHGLSQDQTSNISNAIGQQGDVQNYINGPLQGFLNSSQGLQMLQQLLGSPTSETQKNGGTAGSTNTTIGTSGINTSF